MKFLAAFLVLACTLLNAKSFLIVKDSQPACQFILPEGEKLEEKAKDDVDLFNGYLKQISGAVLPCGAQGLPGTIRIELDENGPLDKRFEWSVTFPNASEMLISATPASLFQALNYILEEGADARFLGIENCMFQYDEQQTIKLPAKKATGGSSFTLNRSTYKVHGRGRELMLDEDGRFKWSHGLPYYAFPFEKYTKGWPEAVMPVLKGKKLTSPPDVISNWQPCYSNPETARIAAENAIEIIRAKHLEAITLGVNDCGCFCECEDCRKLNEATKVKNIFTNVKGNCSGSYYTFVNRVAEIVCKEFPNLRIGLLAYTETIMPPDFPVHKNVVPVLTIDSMAYSLDPMVEKNIKGVIDGWSKSCKEIGIWDYCWGRPFVIPRVNFRKQAELLKYIHAHHGRSYFGENSFMSDANDGPKFYMVSQLMRNIDADPDAILKDWYVRCVGKKAAPYLEKLYKEYENFWQSPDFRKNPFYISRNYVYMLGDTNHLNAAGVGFADKCRALMEQVVKNAKTPAQKKRAEILMHQFEYMDCTLTFGGYEYRCTTNGEFNSADDAIAMLKHLQEVYPRISEEFKSCKDYFHNPDMAAPDAYPEMGKSIDYNVDSLMTETIFKCANFIEDERVMTELKKLAAMNTLPAPTLKALAFLTGSDASIKNEFSNPGFTKPITDMDITASVPYAIDTEVKYNGQNTLRIMPAQVKGVANPFDKALSSIVSVRIIEPVEPATYIVTAKVRSSAENSKLDMVAWGMNKKKQEQNWENLCQVELKKDKWQTFATTRQMSASGAYLLISFRPSGFKANDTLHIADLQIIRIAELPALKVAQKFSGASCVARGNSKIMEYNGEKAVVSNGDYTFAHKVIALPRLPKNGKFSFTFRAASPDGKGALGAIIYARDDDNNWQVLTNIMWNRKLSTEYGEQSCEVTSEAMKGNSGNMLLILFEMRDSGKVAVSSVTYKTVN